MAKMTKRTRNVLLTVGGLLIGGYWWFFLRGAVKDKFGNTFRLDRFKRDAGGFAVLKNGTLMPGAYATKLYLDANGIAHAVEKSGKDWYHPGTGWEPAP